MLNRIGRILILATAAAVAIIVVPSFLAPSARTAPRTVADPCTSIVTASGALLPACSPALSGGSVSAGAPSQGLITAKNLCNLYIGGCSSAFFYPPGSVERPYVDNSVRHSP
jgi:hypothetical protein